MKLFFSICCVFLLSPLQNIAQVKDSLIITNPLQDTLKSVFQHKNSYSILLDSNIYVNSKSTPQSVAITVKTVHSKQSFFYLAVGLLLFLALLKTIFSRYFSTLFRVFFNTSLRQNQLTDQLEQATLPSLLFNVFFVFSAGLYIYFLRQFFFYSNTIINWQFYGICLLGIAVCYFVKYIILLFTGLVTNYSAESKTYIFVVFLLNKIISIFLIPFTLLIAFSSRQLAGYAIFISFIALAILLLTRYFRAYGLLQNKVKINGFHFFIYVLSIEILPIALIYKTVLLFFGKIT